MPRIATFHTIGQFTGTGHYNSASIPTNSSSRPPAGWRTSSGDNPATSIDWNWNGLQDNNPSVAPGAFSTVTQSDPTGTGWRCEKAIGQGVSFTAGEYWLSFGLQANSVFTSYTGDDWNYICQLRSNGSTPSPSPSLGVQTINGVVTLILRVNISGVGSTEFGIGPLDKGGSFHYFRVGWFWSTSSGTGWVRAYRDGVETITKTSIRTALDTSSGASMRWGFYRAPWVGTTPSRYLLWGGELWNSMPPEITTNGQDPDPTPDPGTRPPLPAALYSDAETLGLPASARGTEWFSATANRVRGSVFQLDQPLRCDRVAIPLRGSLSGSGTQDHRGAIYSVTDPNDPNSDVLVVEGSTVSVAFDDEADWIESTFTERTLPAGLYRVCDHAGSNTVTEYLRSTTGSLASGPDTFSDGAASTFAAGAAAIDATRTADIVAHVFPGSGTEGAVAITVRVAVEVVSATLAGTRTPIDASLVEGRFVDAPLLYVKPRYFHKDTGAELEWDPTAGAFYQKED